MTSRLASAKRIVVKVGSALLVDAATGRLRRAWLDALCADLAHARARGQQIVLVSSGAIALGRRSLGLAAGPLRLEESQAAAAVGQIALAAAYTQAMVPHGLSVAQILLTLGDTEERRRFLNARATLQTLLELKAIPVINENDTVATAEIRYGDNDRLAARVASMVSADLLVLLSDIDGLYTDNPRVNPAAEFVPEIADITPAVEAMAGASGSDVGSGGMVTKLIAGRIATAAGCHMVIASGREDSPLARIEAGGRATWFMARVTPMTARKQWISGALSPLGNIHVDEGAERALRAGKSLLPAGVREVHGRFERGDPVSVRNHEGAEIARGLIAYDAADAARIAGRRSGEIETILGYRGRDEMIHRDDLVMMRP